MQHLGYDGMVYCYKCKTLTTHRLLSCRSSDGHNFVVKICCQCTPERTNDTTFARREDGFTTQLPKTA